MAGSALTTRLAATELELILRGDRSRTITSLALSADGKLLAAGHGSPENFVRVWDLTSRRPPRIFRGHSEPVSSVAFSPDGRQLASGSFDGTVRFVDLDTGRVLRIQGGHRGQVTSLAFSPDGSLLAVGASDDAKLWEVSTGNLKKDLKKDLDVWGGLVSVAFSRSGSHLALTCCYGNLRLWTVASNEVVRVRTPNQLQALSFSPDGRSVLAAGYDTELYDLDVASGRTTSLKSGHAQELRTAHRAPPDWVATAGKDKIIRVWNWTEKKLRGELRGHTGTITSVVFCPEQRCLISAGEDGTIRFWDLERNQQVAVMTTVQGRDDWLLVTSEGLYDGTPDGAERLLEWKIGTQLYAPSRLPSAYKHASLLSRIIAGMSPKPKAALSSLLPAPRVSIVDPENGVELGRDRAAVQVRIEDLGGGVADVRLLVNGKPIVERRGPPREGSNRIFDVALEPGENLVRAQAASRQGLAGDDDHIRIYRKSATQVTKPELVLQTGHAPGFDGTVLATRFSPDGRLLATASEDRTIRLWDISRSYELRALVGHKVAVSDVAFSPDGKRLVSADRQRTVRVWDVGNGREVFSFSGFRWNWVNTVAYSPDGRLLAAGGEDRVIHLLDARNGREVGTLAGHEDLHSLDKSHIRQVVFSPDRQSLASRADDKTVRLWDLASGREIHVLRGHPPGVTYIAFSADGQSLFSGGSDGAVKVWDPSTGQERLSWKAHDTAVAGIYGSPDSRTLTTIGRDKILRRWEVSSGRELSSLQDREGTLSPDGRWIASGPNVREVESGRQVVNFASVTRPVHGVAWSQDGRWLALAQSGGSGAAAGNGGGLWDLATGGEVRRLALQGFFDTRLRFSPDGRWLIWGSDLTSDVQLFETQAGRPFTVQHSGTDIASFRGATPDGRLLVSFRGTSAPPHQTQVMIWDREAGQIVNEFSAGELRAGSVAIAPDGTRLVLGGEKASRDGRCYRASLWQVAGGRQNTFPHPVNCGEAAFSPDNTLLAVGDGSNIALRDAASLQLLRTLSVSQRAGPSFAFSPDSRLVAIPTLNDAIELWEAANGKLLHTLAGHTWSIGDFAFAPDGRRLLSGSRDATARLWDTVTGAELRILRGHTAGVNAVAFDGTGTRVATGSSDGSVRLWDITSGENTATLMSVEDGMGWIVVTPDGLFDGPPAAWNRILWRFAGRTEDVAPVEIFFNELYYPGLLADILRGKRPKAPRDFDQLDRRQPQLVLARGGQSAAGPLPSRVVNVRLEVAERPPDQERPAGSGARDVRLFRNGSLVKVWRGDVLKGRSQVMLEVTVPIVAGPNRFTAYAFNRDNIKSADAELVLQGAPSLKRPGTAYILAIGINQYANSDYHLNYAVPDAQAFAQELLRQQKALGQYGTVEVVPLLDQDATRATILAALARLGGADTSTLPPGSPLAKLRRAEPEDAVFVYYAGHGTAAGPRFYLIPHDLGYAGKRDQIDEAGLRTLLAHSLSDRDLERAFESIDAGRLLLVIDACNSGQALEAEEKRRGPMNSKGLAQLAYEKGMYILTAAQGYQAALEVAQLGHGLLTYALVEEALKTPAADGVPQDGRIVMREWLDYAALRVPHLQTGAVEQARKARGQSADQQATFTEMNQQNLQRPRVFYRREPEIEPFVVATVSTD